MVGKTSVRSKRRRAGALQDAGARRCAPNFAKRLKARRPSAGVIDHRLNKEEIALPSRDFAGNFDHAAFG
jgi:hypothetical protein